MSRILWLAAGLRLVAGSALAAGGDGPPPGLQALAVAYPEHIAGTETNAVVWRDGSRMVYDDGIVKATAEAMVERASLKDQMALPYPAFQRDPSPPPADFDPGRARHEPFFLKMYGASEGEVRARLRPVRWMGEGGVSVQMTSVNGVHAALAAVSAELEKADPSLRRFLLPPGGSFNWRPIAKTARLSAHAFGIAFDINPATGQYWQWGHRQGGASLPWEIVEAFERHGFIWGGRWAHFDTFHFEYRPEFLPPAAAYAPANVQSKTRND